MTSLGHSELSASNKVLPTPLSTSTEGGMNRQLTADHMKGGKKSKKSAKKTKKARRSKKRSTRTSKRWFFSDSYQRLRTKRE
jgi:hypothetical protein